MSNWITRLSHYKRLVRFDKPIGVWLLLWPTLTAVWLSSDGRPYAHVLVIFILGVFLMRSAGCIMNDMADRHWDKSVERTSDRPLTTGAVSLTEALVLCAVLCLIAFVLVLCLNRLTVCVAVVAVVLAGIYPFLKRWTYWPQVGLGLAFNLGILMAFTAQQGQVTVIALLYFVASCCMTVAYDTWYAMADRDDDVRVGIKSTAVRLKGKANGFVLVLQLIYFALVWFVGAAMNLNGWFNVGLGMALCMVIYQHVRLRQDRGSEACFAAFKQTHLTLLVVFVATFLGYLR